MSYPTKEERKKCWDARDNFWACLNKNAPDHSSTSGAECPKPCTQFRALFEKNCPAQWVKHFDRKRNYDIFQEKMKKGYDPLERKQPS